MTAARRPTTLALAAGSALAAVLLSGCAGTKMHDAAAEPIATPAAGKADKEVARAEAAVRRSPEQAAARATLGQAYLSAGRFESAATALDDAMSLGDNSPRTALGLALAKLGMGRNQETVALLDDWRGEIPASDLGLALALAGETARGVAVLADALRSGDNTPKVRQNLAYAYALDGRWQEARIMASQDVPADQLDKRLAVWALSTLGDQHRERVAALIGAPVRADFGQPAELALQTSPEAQQVAIQSSAGVKAPEPAAAPVAAPAPAQELPAVAAAEQQPSVVEANLAAQAHPVRQSVAQAFAGQTFSAPAPASVPVRLHTNAVAPRVIAVRQQVAKAKVAPAVAARAVAKGSHLVQLGSFLSQQGARRAWGVYTSRNPGLAAYRMTITPAVVHGQQVWRVAAAGFGGMSAANGLCSQLRAQGGDCFAYAAARRASPAVGVPAPEQAMAGPQMARRR